MLCNQVKGQWLAGRLGHLFLLICLTALTGEGCVVEPQHISARPPQAGRRVLADKSTIKEALERSLRPAAVRPNSTSARSLRRLLSTRTLCRSTRWRQLPLTSDLA